MAIVNDFDLEMEMRVWEIMEEEENERKANENERNSLS